MMKYEFEELAVIDGMEIGEEMYNSVEYFYMSENDYHRCNGGIYETKQDFVKRVFGGKINTPSDICEKLIQESQAENRFALRGNGCVTEGMLLAMDKKIAEHYRTMLKYNM